ncbi:MAG: cell division protein FtsB [Pseudomonadota bacterium]|nr:MAG: cell division protein FtsB [Pseudomonadota bacterium]
MRIIAIVLAVLLIALQYDLWLGKGGFTTVWRLQESLNLQEEANTQSRERNAALQAEVRDLKKGRAAIEERARTEMGMIRDQETFYQIVEQ